LHGGTAPRTLPYRLGFDWVVNVKDWGAKGDGTTEDQPAIQNAVNYAYTLNPGGRNGAVVFFPAGTYNLGTRLRLSTPYPAPNAGLVSLVGAGRDVTILKGNFGSGTTSELESDPNYLLVSFLDFANMIGPLEVAGTSVHRLEAMTIWNMSTVP